MSESAAYVPDEFEERNPRDEINRWRRESELYMRLFGEFRDALTPFAEYLSREKSIYGFDEKDLKPVRDLVKRGLIYVE